MPTIMTHAVTAVAAGSLLAGRRLTARFWILAIAAALLPDADVIGYQYLGIPYGHVLGHRGFFHAPCFAFLFSLVSVSIVERGVRIRSRRWWVYVLLIAAIGASHGLLDAMTNGGRGIALLSPLSNQRYFMPWTPIEVSPIGVTAFFSHRGLTVMQSEFLWVWLPAIALMIVGRTVVQLRNGRPNGKI